MVIVVVRGSNHFSHTYHLALGFGFRHEINNPSICLVYLALIEFYVYPCNAIPLFLVSQGCTDRVLANAYFMRYRGPRVTAPVLRELG